MMEDIRDQGSKVVWTGSVSSISLCLQRNPRALPLVTPLLSPLKPE